MRSSSAASVARVSGQRQHSFAHSVQLAGLTRELTTSLLAPIHLAAYGAKVTEPEIVMLAKNLQRASNKAVETWVKIVDGALRLRADTDLVERHCHLMLAYVRRSRPTSQRTLPELLAIETRLESEINPLQWEFAQDIRNGVLRRHLIRLVRRAIRNLEELLTKLEREEIDAVTRSVS